MNDSCKQKRVSIQDLWRHELTPEVKTAYANHSHIASKGDDDKQVEEEHGQGS